MVYPISTYGELIEIQNKTGKNFTNIESDSQQQLAPTPTVKSPEKGIPQ